MVNEAGVLYSVLTGNISLSAARGVFHVALPKGEGRGSKRAWQEGSQETVKDEREDREHA